MAERQGNLDYVARATANIGGCQFALRQYQPALEAFLEARRTALAAGDPGVAAVFEGNIASLYEQLDNLEAAAEWMKDSLAHISGRDRGDQVAKLQIQMGTLLARQKKSTEAWEYFRQGIDGADRAGDTEFYSIGWDRVGEQYLELADPDPGRPGGDPALRGQYLAAAESALLEAYRVRKLNHLALEKSYQVLGRLRLAQGDLEAAAGLFDHAVELSLHPHGLPPRWDIYYRRGLARLRQGRLPEALKDLRVAVVLGRDWRWSAPLNQTARIATEKTLNWIHSTFIEAGNRLYLATGDPALARETFEVAEENRANSLRSLVAATPQDLTPAFWEALSALQGAEIQALRSPGYASAGAADAALESAHARLVALEASLGPAYRPLPGGLLDRVRRVLGPDAAWLGFHMGDEDSWLWAVDREGMAVYRLPGRPRIVADIQSAADAIRRDSPSSGEASAALYKDLFGTLAPRFRNKSRWLLALDRELLDAPLAALREPTGTSARYLVEGHITQTIPGAGYWLDSLERRPMPASPSLLIGVGDPIYNTADVRLPPPAVTPAFTPAAVFPLRLFAGSRSAQGPTLMLPRLVASAAELDACQRAWPGESVLLEGSAASKTEIVDRLRREPAVVHFATHFLEVPAAGEQADSVIALGLNPRGQLDLLTQEEIAHRPVRADLVVLSGCHSAAGAVLPGAGLLGLTRAFLAAGAGAVVSSRWATPDDDGALFAALYANLGGTGLAACRPAARKTGQNACPTRLDPARALRTAQLSMIHSNGPHSRPSYWSAYFLVGSYEF